MMRCHALFRPLSPWLAAALAAYAVLASGTQAWEMSSYSDFVRGRFDGISLSREGRLSLAPKMETVFTSDQPVIWSVARRPRWNAVYAGTGHRGRVYRIDRTGKGSLLWTAEQPEVFAVAVDRGGAVYAGTSPDGKVYRIETARPRNTSRPGTLATSGRWQRGPTARCTWARAIRARSSA
jgi:hypothetical protein